MKKLIQIIFLVCILSSCSEDDVNEESIYVNRGKKSSESFIDNLIEKRRNLIAKQLNLQSINRDSFSEAYELRLWAKIEILKFEKLYVIKKIGSNWSCFEYSYLVESYGDVRNVESIFTNVRIDSFFVKSISPESEWSRFHEKIDSAKIYTLINQDEIKNWKNIHSDGYTYTIEYVKDNDYRCYSYGCPDLYKDNHIECQQMSNLLNILNYEIGFAPFDEKDCKCLN